MYRLRGFGVLLLPAALAFLVQAPSLSHGFMADDFLIILGNPQITEPSSASDLLWTDWFDRGGTGSIGYYRPVTKASFRLTFALAGPSPFAFHLGNLAIHAVAVLLLTLLLLQLFERSIALVGATLWGLHPMTVQAVQNITARSDVLAGGFFLGTLVLVARWTRTGRWPWLFAAVFPAVLAMGSKESALLLPFAAGVVVMVLGGALRRSLLAFLATSISVVAALLVRFSVLDADRPDASPGQPPLGDSSSPLSSRPSAATHSPSWRAVRSSGSRRFPTGSSTPASCSASSFSCSSPESSSRPASVPLPRWAS